MKILSRIYLIVVGVCLFANIASAQTSTTQPKTLKEQEKELRDYEKDRNVGILGGPLDKLINTTNRPVSKSKTESMERGQAFKNDIKKYTKSLEKMLAAPPAYQEKFAALLENEKMYLVRIYPDKNCDLFGKRIVSVQDTERCDGVIPMSGGGSKYSFKENSNVRRGDLHFIDNKFITGNNIASGIISEIGDVNLQDINLNTEASKFLIEFEPKETLTEIKEQNKLLEGGVNSSGFNYSLSARVKLNSTYILRSTMYQQKWNKELKNGAVVHKKTDKLRIMSDVLVAFKVVGQETDGSVILLWKKLK